VLGQLYNLYTLGSTDRTVRINAYAVSTVLKPVKRLYTLGSIDWTVQLNAYAVSTVLKPVKIFAL